MEILKGAVKNLIEDRSLNYEIKEFLIDYYNSDGHKFQNFVFIMGVKIEDRDYT